MNGYENKTLCAECGGVCCKALPGGTFPEDFGMPDEARLQAALASGRYAIDWWEGDVTGGERGQTYFVRPAVKGSEGELRDPAWGGTCTFFIHGTGCELAFSDRPYECRFLEPMPLVDGRPKCRMDYPCGVPCKKASAIAWVPYQYLLEAL
jgi:Fe-S-cluster containining protein